MPKKRGRARQAVSDGGLTGTGFALSIGPHFDPILAIRRVANAMLDETRKPGPVKTKSQFTDEQIAEMERLYARRK